MGMIGTFSLTAWAQQGEPITIGEGTSTTNEAPVHTYYKYSLTEMIYTAEEIETAGGGAGTINSISFHYALNDTKDFSVVVFMKHVTRSNFPATTTFETLTASDVVYDGTMSVSSPGWVTIELASPFEYNGEENLLIAFDNNTGSYIGSSGSFYYTTASNTLYRYQNDYTNPDPYNFNSYSASTVSSSRPNLKLDITTTPVACAKPKSLTATDVTARTAILDWTKGSDDQDTWEIYLTQSTTDVPTEETVATYDENVTKPFALSNLTPESNYYAYVRANCGSEDGKSKWSNVCSFTTLASCAVPTNLTSSQITTETAMLSWTAGSGQDAWEIYLTTTASEVPTATTAATHPNVDANPYTLTNLQPQTKYYAYVRANCGDYDGKSQWSSVCTFTTPKVPFEIDAAHAFVDSFENSPCGWVFTNGDRTNQWCWGNATNNGGEKAMYISNDQGTSNAYTMNSTTIVYASKLFNFAQGTYNFSFDWKANGESNSNGTTHYDFLRAVLVPGDVELTPGTTYPTGFSATTLPSTWIALDGGHQLNLNGEWQSQIAETSLSGYYTLFFIWRNDSGGGAQPPAAIDNISISLLTCPRPTNLTASNVTGRTAVLTWKENGTADSWTLQYATDANFSANLVEITDGFIVNESNVGFGLTGLSGETKYYVRVKSNCDSSWSDVINFTTAATCEKPTLSYVSNSNTAHTGSVSWTGEAESYELAYRPTNDFDPADETLEDVTRATLESVNEYTLEDLNPETKYYIYIQANCGEEDGKSQWSNRVIFSTLATCLAPSSLTKEATTSSSVTLSWTKGADDQDAWQFRYKKKSENEYSYKLIENLTEPNYTLDGLEPSTEYNVNVRAWCDENDQSKWSYANQNYDLTITTDCAELTVPYFNDFEGLLNTSSPYSTSYPMPKCWTRSGNQTNYPFVFSATTSQPYNHGSNSSSGQCIRFYRNSSSYDAIAVLPAVDPQYQMNSLQLRFWARLENYNSGKDLVIGIMDDPSDRNTFEPVATVTIDNPDNSSLQSYKEYAVTFENYEGNGRYIAIRQNTSMYAIYVDDVTIEEIPSCRIPKDLEAEVDSESQATLTWTAGKDETAWNVQYKKATDSDWSAIIPVTETTYTLTGLKRGTVYEARVQANCNADDQSDWTEAISFTTDCGIIPIAEEPFFEDFENIGTSDFPPICWEKFNHEMTGYSYWYLNANNGLGSGAAYSSYNEGYAFLVMPKMHIDGDANLSFDYLIGTGNYNESCSVVVSTNGMAFDDFSETIWTAEDNYSPSVKANATVSLSDYDNQDVYVAFKYKGSGTSGCTWYVDNVHVYVGEIFTKDITAYSGEGGYYLIASPVGTVSPENETSMLSNSYDLYYFDQSQDKEWINYKGDQALGQEGHFNLESGKGYLYANSNNVTLTFTGTPYNGNGQVDLAYNANAVLKGWNLIGNPFGTEASLDKPYYRLNAEGNALKTETENTPIAAMEGVFVQATAAGEKATFAAVSRGGRSNVAKLNIMVTRNRSVVEDNAIIRFDGGSMLGKFQLNPGHTKVYIPQDGKDYAIVRSAAQGEMPLNFKAEKSGTYTLSFSNEEVTFSYLHLIDNMTGADIDLLQTPNYTFNAKTSDYASRFKVVFAANEIGSSSDSESFAFFRNGNLVVLNEGMATLQVIDMMGRILSSERISGSYETKVDAAPGVYMLRLVSGNEVKIQKVIID